MKYGIQKNKQKRVDNKRYNNKEQMRNIVVQDYNLIEGDQVQQIECVHLNEFRKELVIVSKDKFLQQLDISKNEKSIINELDLSEYVEQDDKVLDCSFVLELDCVVIVTSQGNILKVNIENQEVSEEGQIENGINNCKWSPNQESLVLVTMNRTIVMLDSNIDSKGEQNIDDNDLSDNNQVDVEKMVNIDWRQDSKFFVVNYGFIDSEDRKCLIRDSNLKVFKSPSRSDKVIQNHLNYDMSLVQSVSEKPYNIEGQVSWQPNHSQLITVQQRQGQKFVIIFEKNGLRHGEFMLQSIDGLEPSQIEIQMFSWSNDSDILAILVRTVNNNSYVCFYVRSNYKWYFKNCQQGLEQSQIMNIQFGGLENNKFYIFYKDGSIEIFDIYYNHIHNQLENKGIHVSVNNKELLISDYSRAVIPPPDCLYKLETENTMISYLVSGDRIVMIDDKFVYQYDGDQIIKKIENKYIKNTDRARHLVIVNDWLVGVVNRDGQQMIIRINLCKDVETRLKYQSNIVNMFVSSSYSKQYGDFQEIDFVYFQNKNQEVMKCYLDSQEIETVGVQQCVFKQVKTYLQKSKETIIGLSLNNKLYLDNKLISNECSSFIVNKNFLLFTAYSASMYNQLYIFDLSNENDPIYKINGNLQQIISQLQVQHENIDKLQNLNIRNIEKGSRIVCVHEMRLVLQICPRGNLETINPRMIMLKQIQEMVQQQRNYRKALELLRRHKLDMNLLFDLDPLYFVENTEQVVKSIERTDLLGLLVESMVDNSSLWMKQFVDCKVLQELQKQHIQIGQKVNTVCDKVREACVKVDEKKYVLIILHTFSKKQPAELEEGLQYILKMKASELNNKKKKMQGPHVKNKDKKQIESGEALEYICWMADANRMYDVALSTYDLELVEMVALQTQKDPREYQPYLQSLKGIGNEIDRKVTICVDLKKYSQAVKELANSQDQQQLDRAIELVESHKLFNLGVKIFKDKVETVARIRNKFGEYLKEQKEYQQASLQFYKAKNYDQVIECYKQQYQWQKCIKMIEQQGWNEEQKSKFRKEMLDLLEQSNMFSDVGRLYVEQGQVEVGVEYLIKANDWEYLVGLEHSGHQLPANFGQQVINNISLQYDLKYNELQQSLGDFNIKYQRLQIVQDIKRNQPTEIGENLQNENDAMSEMSQLSQGTFTSIRTAGGGRRKQRKNKSLKKRNIKEGSVYEEEYLIEILKDYKLSHNEFQSIQSLIQYLVYYDLHEQAVKLQNLSRQYVKETNKVLKMQMQKQFEELNPNINEIYPQIDEFKPEKLVKSGPEIEGMFKKFSHLDL